jgi:hypothetical protein
MANYSDIKGTTISAVSSDPTNPIDGQVWYNSTDYILKAQGATLGPRVIGTGTSMPTAKGTSAGGGSITAAWITGGPNDGTTFHWDGASWTSAPSLSRGSSQTNGMGSAGLQTSGLVWAGTNPYTNASEAYNGTSWSGTPSIPTGGSYGNGIGIQPSALSVSLYQGSPFGVCFEYNGSSWSGGGTIPNNNYSVGGCGTQTAGVCVGGEAAPNPPGGTQHQHYNGSSWTAKASLPDNRVYYGNGGVIGSQDDTYASAGGQPSSGLSGEYFNGTAWTSQGTLPSLRSGASSTNSQSNGSENGLIMAGGSPISATVLTIAPSVGAPASRDISVAT